MVYRKSYIQNNDAKEALELYQEKLKDISLATEVVTPLDAFSRITARAIFAQKCDPSYNAAAMDGIMIDAEITEHAGDNTPLTLKRGIDFDYVNTGGAITGNYNSVIMIEDVIIIDDDTVQILSPSYPWQHIRVIGESVVMGELVLASRHTIRAQDVGALIAAGITGVEVYKKPKVAIIPTGKEMIDDPTQLKTGKLMEYNSKVFACLTLENGGQPIVYDVCEDDKEQLKKSILDAIKVAEMVIVNAGSSAGTKDYTVHVLKELGEVVVHGIAIKPGKPTILALVEGKPVIGIPGYPVSAYIVFDAFAKPILRQLGGLSSGSVTKVKAKLTRRITSSFKNSEIIRMAVGRVGNILVTTPLERGAAQIMSLVKADGLLKVDRLLEGVEAGEIVDIELINSIDEIEKSLVIIGSHDMIIDVLSDRISVSSAHVGSMGGITALLNGECHIAPIHLLDEESGIYNISYVKKYFKHKKMALIKGVGRIQGFVVEKNNPKNITCFEDFLKKKVKYTNRQRGAGTRLLFDYNLKKIGLTGTSIFGYEKELGTHLAVAVAVKNKVADTGLAVLSAAKALELDFVPVALEEYDFLVPYEYLEDTRVKGFISVLKSDFFKNELEKLGGYTYDRIGEILVIDND